MITGCPSFWPSLSETARAERSVEPAGGKGTIILIGLFGYWASAEAAEAKAMAASRARDRRMVPPCLAHCRLALPMPRTPRAGVFFALFTLSGFAGLIYQSIWSHYLKLFLGHA